MLGTSASGQASLNARTLVIVANPTSVMTEEYDEESELPTATPATFGLAGQVEKPTHDACTGFTHSRDL